MMKTQNQMLLRRRSLSPTQDILNTRKTTIRRYLYILARDTCALRLNHMISLIHTAPQCTESCMFSLDTQFILRKVFWQYIWSCILKLCWCISLLLYVCIKTNYTKLTSWEVITSHRINCFSQRNRRNQTIANKNDLTYMQNMLFEINPHWTIHWEPKINE